MLRVWYACICLCVYKVVVCRGSAKFLSSVLNICFKFLSFISIYLFLLFCFIVFTYFLCKNKILHCISSTRQDHELTPLVPFTRNIHLAPLLSAHFLHHCQYLNSVYLYPQFVRILCNGRTPHSLSQSF